MSCMVIYVVPYAARELQAGKLYVNVSDYIDDLEPLVCLSSLAMDTFGETLFFSVSDLKVRQLTTYASYYVELNDEAYAYIRKTNVDDWKLV